MRHVGLRWRITLQTGIVFSRAAGHRRRGENLMAEEQTIAVYDSQSHEYHRAFQVFLDHTDQKLKAQKSLTALNDRLPSRRVFIDAVAGNGKMTAWFTQLFVRPLAILTTASY